MAAPVAGSASPNSAAKSIVVRQALREASTALGAALSVSFFADASSITVVAIIGFAVVYGGAAALFVQLLLHENALPDPAIPAWLDNALSALVGAGVGLVIAYSDGKVGLAMTLAVFAALVPTAWRQRWRERRVYRATLSPLPTDLNEAY